VILDDFKVGDQLTEEQINEYLALRQGNWRAYGRRYQDLDAIFGVDDLLQEGLIKVAADLRNHPFRGHGYYTTVIKHRMSGVVSLDKPLTSDQDRRPSRESKGGKRVRGRFNGVYLDMENPRAPGIEERRAILYGTKSLDEARDALGGNQHARYDPAAHETGYYEVLVNDVVDRVLEGHPEDDQRVIRNLVAGEGYSEAIRSANVEHGRGARAIKRIRPALKAAWSDERSAA